MKMRRCFVYDNWQQKGEPMFSGVFHGFFQESSEDGQFSSALVEDDAGKIHKLEANLIRLGEEAAKGEK